MKEFVEQVCASGRSELTKRVACSIGKGPAKTQDRLKLNSRIEPDRIAGGGLRGRLPDGAGGGGIAVDASGNAYVTGDTDSSDFPTTPGALRTTYGGNGDAFVSKLNAAGSSLVYST